MAIRFLDEPERKVSRIRFLDAPAPVPATQPIPAAPPDPTVDAELPSVKTQPEPFVMPQTPEEGLAEMQAELTAEAEYRKEFGWLENPPERLDPYTQSIVEQMQAVWDSRELKPVERLARLRQLYEVAKAGAAKHTAATEKAVAEDTWLEKYKRKVIGDQDWQEAMPFRPRRGAELQDELKEGTFVGDVRRTLAGAKVAIEQMGCAIGQGLTGLIPGDNKAQKWFADNAQELAERQAFVIDEIREQGGTAAVVAQEIGQQALTTAIRSAALGMLPKATGTIANAARMAAITAATTPGSAADRAMAAGRVAILMSTPIPAKAITKLVGATGKMAPVVGTLTDTILNIGGGVAFDKITQLMGRDQKIYDLENPEVLIPALVQDFLFALATGGEIVQAQRTADRLRAPLEQAVGKERADEIIKAGMQRVDESLTKAEAAKTVAEAESAKQAEPMAAEVKSVASTEKPVGETQAKLPLTGETQPKPEPTPVAALKAKMAAKRPPVEPTPADKPLTPAEQREIQAELREELARPETPKPPVKPPKAPAARVELPPKPVEMKTPKEKLMKGVKTIADHLAEAGDEVSRTKAAAIKEDPANFYRVVSTKEIKGYVGKLSESDLQSLVDKRASDEIGGRELGTSAAAELANRAATEWSKAVEAAEKATGENKIELTQKASEAEAKLDRLTTQAGSEAGVHGYQLRAWQEMTVGTPRQEVSKVERELKKHDLSMRKGTKLKLQLQFEKVQQLSREVEAYEDKFRAGEGKIPFQEGIDKLTAMRRELAQATLKAQGTLKDLAPAEFAKQYMEQIQGALLTHVSIARNPVYNMTFIPLVYGPRSALTRGIDQARVAIMRGMGKKATPTTSLPSWRDFKKGFIEGGREAYQAARHGFTPTGTTRPLGERVRGARPFRAIQQLVEFYRDPSKSNLPVGPDGKVPGKILAAKAMEAMGMIPTGMLRMLPFGDRPFIAPVRRMQLRNIGKTEFGLSGEALERFIEAPPKEALMIAEAEAKQVSFQEENAIAKWWNESMGKVRRSSAAGPVLLKPLGPAAEIVLRATTSPYMTTLMNLAKWTARTIDPKVSGLEAFAHSVKATDAEVKRRTAIKKANAATNKGQKARYLQTAKAAEQRRDKEIRSTEQSVAMFAVASAHIGIGVWLAENNIMTPTYEELKQKTKERTKIQEGMGLGRFNISGLTRALAGKNPAYKSGDMTIDSKMLGPAGLAWQSETNIARKREREDKRPEEIGRATELFTSMGAQRLQNALGVALQSTVAQGTQVTLNALIEGDWEDFIPNAFNVASSPYAPNELKHITKMANRELRQRRPVGVGLDYFKNMIDREFALTYGVVRSREEYDRRVPKIYSPYTGETVPTMPSFLSGFDPLKTETKDLHPTSRFLVELQARADAAGMDVDVFPSVPSAQMIIRDKQGKKYRVGRDRDLLQKLNKLHGEIISKYAKSFGDVPEDIIVENYVKQWKKAVRAAKKEFRIQATRRLGVIITGKEEEDEE